MDKPNAIDAAILAVEEAETASRLATETLKQALEDAEAAEKHLLAMHTALREAVKARREALIGGIEHNAIPTPHPTSSPRT